VAAFFDKHPEAPSEGHPAHQGRRGTVRLVVICREADPVVLGEPVRLPGICVELMRLDVAHQDDGRRFVALTTLAVMGSADAESEDEDEDADLADLARALAEPVVITWDSPRRGRRYHAALLPDGFIEFADGRRFRHPDAAASAACGAQVRDGWAVWCLPTGESLEDAFRARHV
jgi:hypothetical protein